MKTRKMKNSHAVALGRKGGKAGKGAAKARSSEQAQAAAFTRWAKVKAEEDCQEEEQQDQQGKASENHYDFQTMNRIT